MTVHISNLIQNERYIRLYYPTDDTIRNKGNLTLLCTEHCDILSDILQLIFKRITKEWNVDEDIIPDEGVILKEMKGKIMSEEYELVRKLCVVIQNRLPKFSISKNDVNILTWEMIERVLNVVVGESVSQYYSKLPTRLNDVNFCKRNAAKCE